MGVKKLLKKKIRSKGRNKNLMKKKSKIRWKLNSGEAHQPKKSSNDEKKEKKA